MPGSQSTADDLLSGWERPGYQRCPTELREEVDENTITGERRLKYDEVRAGGARSRTSRDQVISC